MKILKNLLLLPIVCLALLAAAVATAEESFEDIFPTVRWQAENGDAIAQYTFGIFYGEKKEDKSEAVSWFRKAAEQGHVMSQIFLGNAYYSGEGVEGDKSEAVRWYLKAVEQRSGLAHIDTDVGPYGYGGLSVHWYHEEAEQGLIKAQSNLGNAYYKGEGVKDDHSEAVRWLRKAAEQGDVAAQSNLGNAYYNGKGIKEDKNEAVRWYRKAAEQGYAKAQYDLGLIYVHNRGIKKDYHESLRWHHKAAEQGYVKAQSYLCDFYWAGIGIIENQYEAYIWCLIAKANRSEYAYEFLQQTTLSHFLTGEEIISAKREATQRFAEIEKRQEPPQSTDNLLFADMVRAYISESANQLAKFLRELVE